MRADFDALKDTLSRQEIVSDRLLRETMRGKVSGIRNRSIVSIACAVFVILASPLVFHYNPSINASWAFVAATDVLMFFCIYMDWRFRRNVQRTDLSCCDLLTFSKDVRKLKADYKGWMKWAVILAALWLAWLSHEVWVNFEEPKLAIVMIAALAVGFVIGAVIGCLMNRQTVKACDEIIKNIEE